MTSLAGCSGRSNDGPDTAPPPTESPTSTPTPEFQGYEAEHIGESGTINLVPADPDAEYAKSGIFDRFSATGEDAIDVRLDLQKAYEQRHYKHESTGLAEDDTYLTSKLPSELTQQEKEEGINPVRYFVRNVRDEEWRRDLLDLREEKYDEEIESFFDWDTFADTSKDFETRVKESGLMRFWTMYELGHVRGPGISSTNNDIKAAAFQGIERLVEGSDVFIWDYQVKVTSGGNHGLWGAIENPARRDDPVEQQEVYVGETDPGRPQQVEPNQDSYYLGPDTGRGKNHEHPSEEDFDGRESHVYALYERVGRGRSEGDIYKSLNIAQSLYEQFREFYADETTYHGGELIDQIIAAYYIVDMNDSHLYLGPDKLGYRKD